MNAFVRRAAAVILVALPLAACGGAAETSSAPSAAESATTPLSSDSESPAASTTPSDAGPSETARPSACLDADVLAAFDAYAQGDIPSEPSMEEVADALEALELDGRTAEYRDGSVAALRGETGETLAEMKLHDALLAGLLILRSDVDFVAC